MKRKIMSVLLVAAFTISMFAGSSTAAKAVSAVKVKTIGYVLAGADIYYQKGFEVFDALGKKQGWKIFKTTSDYDPKKETNNVQDMIAKKVDAIVLCTVNSANGSKCAELANKAGIPIFFITALPDPNGPGKPNGSVSGPWYQGGVEDGMLIGKKFGPNCKIVCIEGAYGQGTAELHRMGLLKALADAWHKTPEKVFQENVVYNQTGGWMTDKAQNVMQDAMAKTGGKFDVIFVHNEAMKDGVLKAVKAAGKKYPIYTINGQEVTVAQVKSGVIEATVSIPPTTEAEMVFQQVKAKLAGKKYPIYLKNINVQVTKTTAGSSKILPWLDSAKYVKLSLAGKTGIDIFKLKDSGPTDPNWDAQTALNGVKSK